MNFFLSLGLIFTLGFFGGWLFEKIHLPRLVFYLLLGILLGPSFLDIIDPTLLEISSLLRQIALVIILTRSGLSLNIASLKSIGRPAILMCFLPATFEIIGVTLFAPMFFGISVLEALLLGSVLGAVSPAVVVPRMLSLMERKRGELHHVPELVMAGSSCDDIFVIVVFYSVKGMITSGSLSAWSIAQIPISILSGLVMGLAFGAILLLVYRYMKSDTVLKAVLFFGVSLSMVGLESVLKPYFSVSSLLGVIVCGILILFFRKEDASLIRTKYDALWKPFEILLFVLVGSAVDAKLAFTEQGALILGLLLISLTFRSLGVLCCLILTPYTFRERVFILLSYLPKATVQASIGGIALSEGLACGNLVLVAAVVSILFTAPLGAILMDTLQDKLLS